MLVEFTELSKELCVERMFGRVVQAIYRLLPVQRATVFIVDGDAGVLRAIESCDANQIIVPINKGIAGAVAQSGQAELVRDAYADPRFDRSVDAFTGFRTTSILAVPVVSESGTKVVAVLQALNRTQEGGHGLWNEADLMLLEMFATLLSGLLARVELVEGASPNRDRTQLPPNATTLCPHPQLLPLTPPAHRVRQARCARSARRAHCCSAPTPSTRRCRRARRRAPSWALCGTAWSVSGRRC